MARERREPQLEADGRAPLQPGPPPVESEDGGRGWWLLLALLLLAGLGWYLWDRGHIERWRAALFDEPPPVAGPVSVPEATPAAGGLAAEEAMELERLLAALELAPGPVDGKIDAATTAAVKAFQEMAGLPPDGKATPALLEELRAVAGPLGVGD